MSPWFVISVASCEIGLGIGLSIFASVLLHRNTALRKCDYVYNAILNIVNDDRISTVQHVKSVNM